MATLGFQYRSYKDTNQGFYSLSGKTSYRQISWSLEAARLGVMIIAPRQRCCRGACQISERLEKSKPESRDFETSRDLAVRRLTAQWIEARYYFLRFPQSALTFFCFLLQNASPRIGRWNLSPVLSANMKNLSRFLKRVCKCVFITSSNRNIFRITGLCEGNPPVTGAFPSQRPVTRGFDVFFYLRLNKRLSKQLIETPVIWDAIALIMTSLSCFILNKAKIDQNLGFCLFGKSSGFT